MARNTNVTKMKRQKFRKHRGPYKARSDASTLDPGYNNPVLQKFWAERVTPRSGGPTKAGVPEKYDGLLDYRQRGNSFYDPWLETIFPGVFRISTERERVGRLIIGLMNATTQSELHFVMWRTKTSKLMLYFNPTKDCWWFVFQERYTLKTSITYGSKERAQAVCATDSIRWKTAQVFKPDSS